MLAEPGFHTRCWVERDEYPRRCIIEAQRAGYFAPSPIWDDITTFDGRPWRGIIDTITAGYPCQPFSLAGQRRGENDERHLWPHVARIIREVDPDWVFLENVAGHLTLGGETVLRELWDMGRTPAAGIFSAGETGAPHERQRIFIVAHRAGAGRAAMDNAECIGRSPRRDDNGCNERDIIGPAGQQPLAHAERDARYERRCGSRINSQARTFEKADRASASSETVHPPGPGNIEGWRAVLRERPDLAPAIGRRGIVRAARTIAAGILSTAAAPDAQPGAFGVAHRAPEDGVDGPQGGVLDPSAIEPAIRRISHGLAFRALALRAIGNGVHPLAAAHAWRSLAAAHGLGRVDLGAAGKNSTATAADELVLTNH